MVVAVISTDAYPFLASSDMTCHLEDIGIGVFWFQCRVLIWKQKKASQKNPTVTMKLEQNKN